MTFPSAVVIGKFYPPHRGHKLLIDAALAQSRLVTVIVCGKPGESPAGPQRAAWVQEIHPGARVMLIDDRYDENDTAVWAANTIQWLGGPPQAVFTSEDYGERYAQALGAVHVMVDQARDRVPCRGRLIRADPFAHWDCLEPPVRGWYARRICVLGAESTGTTTLAQALATHYATLWVPEYGREVSVRKQQCGEVNWCSQEFVDIAAEQTRREEQAARQCNRLIIGDTNAQATRLWHRRYMGCEDAALDAEAAKARCDLYLLTGDEIPFIQDGLRDGEHLRHEMHQWFQTLLAGQSVPWLLLRGTHEERMRQAIDRIDELFVPRGNTSRTPRV